MKKILTISLLLASISFIHSQVSVPNSFNSGETISATEMNANFQALVDAVNTMQTTVTTSEDTIATLTSDLDAAEETISTLESENLTLSNNLTTLENQVESITNLPIGTIISSMMEPTEFNTLMGDVWVLADGRSSTTEYFTAFGNANIPDMRGQFLRGMNENRNDSFEDPETREVGSLQIDTLGSHDHTASLSGSTSIAGAHSHSMTFYQNNGNTGSNPYGSLSSSSFSKTTSTSGEHSHTVTVSGTTESTGSTETRPTNITVYWYIKVK